jgi:co-chaperonin GroES (HSP10)
MKILGTSVLIKPDILPKRTKSGTLIIPKNSKEMLPQWGIAVDVGKACKVVKIGDHLNFPRESATVIVIDDVDHYIISEHKMLIAMEKLKTKI